MKIEPILQDIGLRKSYERLPPNWNIKDIEKFSRTKTLWDFQLEALKNVIVCLYLYFKEDNRDKMKFYQRYINLGLNEALQNELVYKVSKDIRKTIEKNKYFPLSNGEVDFHHFINRLACWMATGSGKSLIIVKLIEVLYRLIRLKEIPKLKFLLLTYREDLIEQLKEHVREYNELSSERGFKIRLHSLKDYDLVRFRSLVPFTDEISVFYYRSDLLSEEQKTRKIDFKKYENNGTWYVFLDEAHKGAKKESKLQMLYSIFARNGFLFNFSATFTDPEDIITTAYNYNLERFIKNGYGKHIYLSTREILGFRRGENYTDVEKQRIVLRSLILLTYIKKMKENLSRSCPNIYHTPLMLTLVNTVQLQNQKGIAPDLTLFFEELRKIAVEEYEQLIFEEQKQNLISEFCAHPFPFFIYENIPIELDKDLLNSINGDDVLNYIFNSNEPGKVEAAFNPKNKKEVVFKLVSSDKYFALIKIGNAQKWIKDNLSGRFEIQERVKDESIFEQIEGRDEICILIGSRAFYEGWDSNRPNVILYINIGTQTESKKFVLQSIGRGIRIEPLKDRRKRLENLHIISQDNGLFRQIGPDVIPLETLFVFGTKKEALKGVLEALKYKGKFEAIQSNINDQINTDELFIPEYGKSRNKIINQNNPQPYPVYKVQLEIIMEYFNYLDDKVLLIANNLTPEGLALIKKTFEKPGDLYLIISGDPPISSLPPIDITIPKLLNHFNKYSTILKTFKNLDNEINHFRQILVEDDKFDEFKDLFEETNETNETYLYEGEVVIDMLENHYYNPTPYSTVGELGYIKHIIKVEGETRFIETLKNYIQNNTIDADWWAYSKLDEYLDKLYIPYFDGKEKRYRDFIPDFIFWLKKDNNYFIKFVDPKGVKFKDYEYKVKGFKEIFEENGKPKVVKFKEYDVQVSLYLYQPDLSQLTHDFREYWTDNIEDIFDIKSKP